MSYEDIKDDLAFLEGWEDRLEYVIDMGKALPPLAESEMTPSFKVEGCASQVWLVPDIDGDKLTFRGGSDAMIVQGLIAVLLARFSGRTPAEILAIDAKADFDELGLSAHLSGQRSNGLHAMIQRIQTIAQQTGKG